MGVSTKLLGDLLIIVAAVLTVWSMLYYLQRAAGDPRKAK